MLQRLHVESRELRNEGVTIHVGKLQVFRVSVWGVRVDCRNPGVSNLSAVNAPGVLPSPHNPHTPHTNVPHLQL